MSVYAKAYGLTKFRKNDDSIYKLAVDSAIDLIKRFKINKDEIDGIIISTSSSEPYMASIISEMLGIKPKIANKLEQMCSSGSSAIIDAYSYLLSGLCKNILIIGVDKYDTKANQLEWDANRGDFKHPAHWAALFAKAHMREYNTSEDDLALVTVKNRRYACKNEYAYFNDEVSIEEVKNSRIIVEPLRLYHCSYPCNGASSILLTNEPDEKPVKIIGIGAKSVGASIASIDDLRSITSSRVAAKEAYSMASIDAKIVDIAEVHDAFSICEIMLYEDLGFVEKGKGGVFAREVFDEKSKVKVNTRGGLLGCGHPVGASGISQTVEIVMQLREEAGMRQIKDCKIGMVHNMSAAGTTSNVIIMEKDYG